MLAGNVERETTVDNTNHELLGSDDRRIIQKVLSDILWLTEVKYSASEVLPRSGTERRRLECFFYFGYWHRIWLCAGANTRTCLFYYRVYI
jgi:hypothetical protein